MPPSTRCIGSAIQIYFDWLIHRAKRDSFSSIFLQKTCRNCFNMPANIETQTSRGSPAFSHFCFTLCVTYAESTACMFEVQYFCANADAWSGAQSQDLLLLLLSFLLSSLCVLCSDSQRIALTLGCTGHVVDTRKDKGRWFGSFQVPVINFVNTHFCIGCIAGGLRHDCLLVDILFQSLLYRYVYWLI